MNGLSWIIYLAEVAGNLSVTAGLVALIGAVGGLVAFCVSPVLGETYSYQSAAEQADIRARPKKIRSSVLRVVLPIVALSSLIAILVPSKSTIMLIGASQVGEQVLQLQEVQQVGGEAGALATDTIKMLRQMVAEQIEKPEAE